jgi:hypothetical protein
MSLWGWILTACIAWVVVAGAVYIATPYFLDDEDPPDAGSLEGEIR